MANYEDWEIEDWVDLIPMPGSFVSPRWDDYEIHGEIINALNFVHAEYIWLQRQVDRSGEEWARCIHCNHAIRYAVIFRDSTGLYHLVGQDCAAFIKSKLPKHLWREKQILSEIKEINTKRGVRYALTMEASSGLWDIERPEFVSVFKSSFSKGRNPRLPWMMTIWGETPGGVIKNWEDLRKLLGRGVKGG